MGAAGTPAAAGSASPGGNAVVQGPVAGPGAPAAGGAGGSPAGRCSSAALSADGSTQGADRSWDRCATSANGGAGRGGAGGSAAAVAGIAGASAANAVQQAPIGSAGGPGVGGAGGLPLLNCSDVDLNIGASGADDRGQGARECATSAAGGAGNGGAVGAAAVVDGTAQVLQVPVGNPGGTAAGGIGGSPLGNCEDIDVNVLSNRTAAPHDGPRDCRTTADGGAATGGNGGARGAAGEIAGADGEISNLIQFPLGNGGGQAAGGAGGAPVGNCDDLDIDILSTHGADKGERSCTTSAAGGAAAGGGAGPSSANGTVTNGNIIQVPITFVGGEALPGVDGPTVGNCARN